MLAIQYHKGDFRVTHTNIVVFLSDRLIEKAERLQVPVPQDEKYWTAEIPPFNFVTK